MSEPLLCRVDDLDAPGAKGFRLADGRELLIVRDATGVYAYANRCPHTGVPLDWVPDQFLDLDRHHIQCATHDARFRLHDGFCVAGPCAGQSLTPLTIRVTGDEIRLSEVTTSGHS